MANQILAGAVIQAGMVIAGVDADNPPVTSSGSSSSGDQYWDNVTLLLREDPNSNDVIDVSSFGTEVSEYDSLGWDSSKPGDAWGNSLYANSTQQDQRVWNNSFGSGVQFGTEDYTIDFWVKTNHLDMIRLFDQNTLNNGGFVFRLSWGKIHYGENSGVNNTSYHQHHHGTTVLSDGEWHYIAIARESGTTRIWADGSLEVEFASSMNFQQEGFSLNAGITNTAPRWVNDFRITKGVARYTGSGSIDVPTAPHPTSSGSESSEESSTPESNVVGLFKTPSVGSISDVTGTLGTPVINGNAVVNSSRTKFQPASINLTGGGYIEVPYNGNQSSLDFGTDPFTVECWVWRAGAGSIGGVNSQYDTIMSTNLDGSDGWGLYVKHAGNRLTWRSPNDPMWLYVDDEDWGVPLSDWAHVAVSSEGSGGNLRMFIDGVERLSVPAPTSNQNTSSSPLNTALQIGRQLSTGGSSEGASLANEEHRRFSGYIEDIRITKGVAHYTEAFTPPTADFA